MDKIVDPKGVRFVHVGVTTIMHKYRDMYMYMYMYNIIVVIIIAPTFPTLRTGCMVFIHDNCTPNHSQNDMVHPYTERFTLHFVTHTILRGLSLYTPADCIVLNSDSFLSQVGENCNCTLFILYSPWLRMVAISTMYPGWV